MNEAERSLRSADTLYVWDLPFRAFHWTLAAGILYEILFDAGTWTHNAIGYSILGLVAFRIVWGFMGSHYARFGEFLRSPVVMAQYAWSILKGNLLITSATTRPVLRWSSLCFLL